MIDSRRLGTALTVVLTTAALYLLLTAVATAASITEFEIEPGAAIGTVLPRYIKTGPDGNLWYTVVGTNPGIGRISPTGERFAEIPDADGPADLAFAPDGTLFWTGDRGIGTRSPSGTVQVKKRAPTYGVTVFEGNMQWGEEEHIESESITFVCRPSGSFGGGNCRGVGEPGRDTGLITAPDGTLWAALPEANIVSQLSPAEDATIRKVEFPVGSEPSRLAVGSDGNIWVTVGGASAVDRITATERKRFPLPPGSRPNDIVSGPDGALWFTEFDSNKIARMTTAGVVTNEYAIPTPKSQPIGLTVGPEGNIWFTESAVGKIGRLVPGGSAESGGGGGPGGGGKPGAPKFTQKPSFSPARFAVAGGAGASAAHGGKKAPRGTKLDLGLSEAATVTAAISKPAAGRKRGKKCVAPGAAPKGAAKCRRYVVKGKVTWSAASGTDKLPFSGKVHGKALTPGGYRATVVARDSGGAVSEEKLAAFTILAG